MYCYYGRQAAMVRTVLLVWLAVVCWSSPSSSAATAPTESCRSERMAVYRVFVQTFWSREKFPKHYPEFRPPAQFSKFLGRTHDSSLVLWRLGSLASKGVKDFAEKGNSDLLDSQTQGHKGVLDEFVMPAVPKGVGKSEAVFFADGNHSKVSFISRIIPSPDWFIGIDSLDLCVQGKWVEMEKVDLDPIDAGTGNGYTYTAPKWSTDPQEKIYQITSQFPNHAANSFYYPYQKKLPTIATVTFVKTKEYELTQTFSNEIPSNLPPQKTEETGRSGQESVTNDVFVNSVKQKKNQPQKRRLGPRHCRVGDWTEWSACSRTCGIGEKRRTRPVLKHARRGGRACPNLVETSWCGNARCSSYVTDYPW